MISRRLHRLVSLASLVFAACIANFSSAAPTETVIHDFRGDFDGLAPNGGLIVDQAGALYGTAQTSGKVNYGLVFKMTPPTSGATAWSISYLHHFKGGTDGASPRGDLTMDQNGALYGATADGGAHDCGTIFKLSPATGGSTYWAKTILYSFGCGADGAGPNGGLVVDRGGVIFGTTYGNNPYYGTVFRLTPPVSGQTIWKEKVLVGFTGANGQWPLAGLTQGKQGMLYGVVAQGGAFGYGVIFQLAPPSNGQSSWTETIIHNFTAGKDGAFPQGRLIVDDSGSLYGTTPNGGTYFQPPSGSVFELVPPAAGQTEWTEIMLHRFRFTGDGDGAVGRLLRDRSGALYGATGYGSAQNSGTVFRLAPPLPGKTYWRETLLHSFDGNDGYTPTGGLAADRAGNLYGTTENGGMLGRHSSSEGVIFQISP